jgi:hypothetical protein
MSTDKEDQRKRQPEQEGEALLIKGRVAELEREQEEARKRDEDYKKRQTLYSKRVAWFTGALVLTSLITNLIYLDMSCTARKSANAAKSAAGTAADTLKAMQDQFNIDERPYVWMSKDQNQIEYFETAKQIAWKWQYTNDGKTPANNIRIWQYMRIGDRDIPAMGPLPIYGGPLPPGKDDFATVISDPVITIDQWEKIIKMDNSIQIRIRISYTGLTSAIQGETKFCSSRLSSQAVAFCDVPDGNYIK